MITGNHCSVVVCAAILTLCFSFSSAAEGPDAGLQVVLDDFHAANPAAPGIVVHVESPSRGLDWTAAVGTAAKNPGGDLTAAHTFRIASNTKTYVAAAVLRLAETGRLSLDDSLDRHLSPDQRALLDGDVYDLEAMTIGQVLCHTSGLFDHPADPRYEQAVLADPHHGWTRLEQITRCVEWGDPVGAPGEKFSYSDTGYIILGGIIERKTGRNLGAAVRDLLGFEELGLDTTWWEILEEQPAAAGPRAHQFYGDLDTFDWNPSLDLYGGGGLVCDVRDLAVFMRLLLQGKVLQQDSSLAAMTGGGTAEYRLGLSATDFGDHLGWGHTGFWNTFVFHVPALDLTVSGCILNHHAEKGRELARRLVEAVATGSQ
ncbi:MAG: serine hydrolase domain-containing protein [Candidatus Krumholzibacteriota bacterium]